MNNGHDKSDLIIIFKPKNSGTTSHERKDMVYSKGIMWRKATKNSWFGIRQQQKIWLESCIVDKNICLWKSERTHRDNEWLLEDNDFVKNSMEQMSNMFSRPCYYNNTIKGNLRTDIKRFHQIMLWKWLTHLE